MVPAGTGQVRWGLGRPENHADKHWRTGEANPNRYGVIYRLSKEGTLGKACGAFKKKKKK